ncbi:MAG TPA: Gfo/Idh/MocA family oxidoreductase [Candidatus Latescibacteria bacterium]|jgi:myo-inositol 2-dehydrogenase/D-chiro-inositol 1-dehydrogenase|nr:hypothetical protein [Gemmatimonadaceae bacterium]MDP6014806.1 Gfo/Idh/MocA family oxidoreductase [Candidatus Latescibacterota bacterium]HJP34222.1 Gfo/Idh/MocA family oxidoreductase [Candidatus Latescibacterota bacterium]
MSALVKVAAIGVGRIGRFHARHVQEVADESGTCRLVAVADRHGDTAKRVAAELSEGQDRKVQAFDSPEALATAGVADAAVVASRTADHERDTRALVDAGMRVLLEKPLGNSLAEARSFGAWLDEGRSESVMLAFQRRYDTPLLRAKALLDDGAIGTLFKVVSVLEDPKPPPAGYQSAGLLTDMGVHNADEILWLSDLSPTALTGMGARLYNQRIEGVVEEDFDDAFVQLWLGGDDAVVAQIQVSRNHVAGYRNETTLYGTEGLIHVGHFDDDPLKVRFEAYGREHDVIEKRAFPLRDYDRPVPVFIRRFGPAYKAEVADFVAKCASGEPFAVTHHDGLRAMEVVSAAASALRTSDQAEPFGS